MTPRDAPNKKLTARLAPKKNSTNRSEVISFANFSENKLSAKIENVKHIKKIISARQT
jgi:hypothetical protein